MNVIAYLVTLVNSANRNVTLVNSEKAVIKLAIAKMEIPKIATLLPEIVFAKNHSKVCKITRKVLNRVDDFFVGKSRGRSLRTMLDECNRTSELKDCL